MTRNTVRGDPDRAYRRNVRLAAAAALGLLIAGFLFIQVPEAKPYQPSGYIEPVIVSVPLDILEPPADPPDLPVRPSVSPTPYQGRQGGLPAPADPVPTDDPVGPPPVDAPAPLDWAYHKVEVKPVLVRRVVPDYPELARQAGIEGMAVVEFVIDTSGAVTDVRVLKSSGNSLLDAAAVDAMAGSRFRPGYQLDRPVRVRAKQLYRFRLD